MYKKLVSNIHSYSIAHDGFASEVKLLQLMEKYPYFNELGKSFENYAEFLDTSRERYFGSECLDSIKLAGMVQMGEVTDCMAKSVGAINLAAVCSLFSGWKIPRTVLQSRKLYDLLEESITQLGPDKEKATGFLANKLNIGDTCRVIHMLKMFGLLPTDISDRPHISFGASGGIRERTGIHQMPKTLNHQANALLRDPTPESIEFDITNTHPEDLILVDNDPDMSTRYTKLNKERNILALNMDALEAMDMIRTKIDDKGISARTLVSAFRLDHRMIPDCPVFIDRLGSIISDSASFIATIGAGHSNEEFLGRKRVMNALLNILQDRGLDPKLFIWHRGTSATEQRRNPIFGSPAYATYEVLFCTLQRDALQ